MTQLIYQSTLEEIAIIHQMDDEIFPLFYVAAYQAAALIPGTCKRVPNTEKKGDDLIALKNSDGTMIVLFVQPEHISNFGIYANPISDHLGPQFVYGINISKYL